MTPTSRWQPPPQPGAPIIISPRQADVLELIHRGYKECLAWALGNPQAGVWGGKSELERKRIAGYRPECGSPKGYKYHQKRREAACNLCREANAGRIRDYRQERRRVS